MKESRQLSASGQLSPAVDRLAERKNCDREVLGCKLCTINTPVKPPRARTGPAREAESKARTARLETECAKRLDLLKAGETAQKTPGLRKYSDSEWQRWLDQRHSQLVAEARNARAASSYDLADQLLSTAFALRPRVEVAEELGQIRAQMTGLAQSRARRDAADRDDVQRRQREKDLVALRRGSTANEVNVCATKPPACRPSAMPIEASTHA